MRPVELLGGPSVYCISEIQLQTARELAASHPVSSPKIQAEIGNVESRLDRNERAALAFVLIDRLLQAPAS
jgi:hypothetical protein